MSIQSCGTPVSIHAAGFRHVHYDKCNFSSQIFQPSPSIELGHRRHMICCDSTWKIVLPYVVLAILRSVMYLSPNWLLPKYHALCSCRFDTAYRFVTSPATDVFWTYFSLSKGFDDRGSKATRQRKHLRVASARDMIAWIPKMQDLVVNRQMSCYS